MSRSYKEPQTTSTTVAYAITASMCQSIMLNPYNCIYLIETINSINTVKTYMY